MSKINIRAKGANGEREIVNLLEPIVRRVYASMGRELPEKNILQRNQNQSAVGGSDLSNTFGLAIEVKRQEQLAIPAWWKQCTDAAERNGERPVLIYRQNNKRWNVVMNMYAGLPYGSQFIFPAQISMEDFQVWFATWVTQFLLREPDSARV